MMVTPFKFLYLHINQPPNPLRDLLILTLLPSLEISLFILMPISEGSRPRRSFLDQGPRQKNSNWRSNTHKNSQKKLFWHPYHVRGSWDCHRSFTKRSLFLFIFCSEATMSSVSRIWASFISPRETYFIATPKSSCCTYVEGCCSRASKAVVTALIS